MDLTLHKLSTEKSNKNIEAIPVIDISCISLKNVDPAYRNYEELGTRLCKALSTCGFAYLSNHGIPERTVSECKAVSEKFFNLPSDVKLKYRFVYQTHITIQKLFHNYCIVNFFYITYNFTCLVAA